MADYSIIADVSNYIVKMLRERMCPEPIPSSNNIQISTPTAQDVDYLVGLYLYDIKEEGEIAIPQLVRSERQQLRRPPRPYKLFYMVFINGSSQMGLKAPDTQKIIGRIAQVINDNAAVSPRALQPWLEAEEPPISFSQTKITLEEKVRVWQALHKPYQLSLFYKAAPVFLSSEVTVNVPMVTEATFEFRTDKREGGAR